MAKALPAALMVALAASAVAMAGSASGTQVGPTCGGATTTSSTAAATTTTVATTTTTSTTLPTLPLPTTTTAPATTTTVPGTTTTTVSANSCSTSSDSTTTSTTVASSGGASGSPGSGGAPAPSGGGDGAGSAGGGQAPASGGSGAAGVPAAKTEAVGAPSRQTSLAPGRNVPAAAPQLPAAFVGVVGTASLSVPSQLPTAGALSPSADLGSPQTPYSPAPLRLAQAPRRAAGPAPVDVIPGSIGLGVIGAGSAAWLVRRRRNKGRQGPPSELDPVSLIWGDAPPTGQAGGGLAAGQP